MANRFEQFVEDAQPSNRFAQFVEDPAQVPIGTTGTPDIGQGTAAALGGIQGITANFGDEGAGLVAASLVGNNPAQSIAQLTGAGPMGLPISALKGAAKLLYENASNRNQSRLTGEDIKGPATRTQEEVRDYVRELDKQAQEQYPGTHIAGEIGGAVLSPGSRLVPLAKGAGWLARAGNAAVNSGIYGTAAGAGSGETLPERAQNAAVGGTIGTVAGGALSPVADVVGKGIGAAGRAVSSPFSNLSAWRNPERAAGNVVASAVRQAERTGDRTALSRAEFDKLQAAGEPVSVMDVAGDAGRNLARRTRNEPGAFEGRQAVQDVTNERYLGQGGRFADDVEKLSIGNHRIDTEDLRAAASPINNINYKAAHEQSSQAVKTAVEKGATRPLLTDRFIELLQSPIAQRALAPAAEREANRSVVEGARRAGQFPLVVEKTEAGNVKVSLRQSKQIDPDTGKPKSNAVFNLHAMDAIARSLRDFAGAAERSGNRELSRDVTILRKAWLAEADSLIPAYAKARGEAFKRFKAEDAFEAGQNFIKRVGKMGDREFALAQREVASWNQTERDLFKRGGGQELAQWLRSIPENQDVVPKILNSQAARKQMEMILGAPAVRRLEARKRVEQIMEFGHKAVSGNSTTAFQLALERGGNSALAGAGIGGGYALLSGDNPFTSGAIASGLLAGNKRLSLAVNAKVLDNVGKMLASGNRHQYEAAINSIMKNEKLFDAVRKIALSIERGGAGTAGGEAAPQIAQRVPLMIGRAGEEDQPVR